VKVGSRTKASGRGRKGEEENTLAGISLDKVVPCVAYATSSAYMTLAQKYVVMSLRDVKSIFLFYQNFAALFLFIPAYLGWLERFRITRYDFWDTKVALRVLPLGITYTIMLYSSNYALSLLSVPMVSVLKNLGPILITVTESWMDKHPLSTWTLVSMGMLVLGSMVAGYNDLQYDTLGYLAMFFNVSTNLCHVQLTKYIQKTGGIKKEVVLHYQSVFMCIFLIPLLMGQNVPLIISKLLKQNTEVVVAFLSTGVNGIVIALCSMWCIERTSGSTYSMVGALNKIPSSILGLIIFNDPIDVLNLIGVAIGLVGGIVFTVAGGK